MNEVADTTLSSLISLQEVCVIKEWLFIIFTLYGSDELRRSLEYKAMYLKECLYTVISLM